MNNSCLFAETTWVAYRIMQREETGLGSILIMWEWKTKPGKISLSTAKISKRQDTQVLCWDFGKWNKENSHAKGIKHQVSKKIVWKHLKPIQPMTQKTSGIIFIVQFFFNYFTFIFRTCRELLLVAYETQITLIAFKGFPTDLYVLPKVISYWIPTVL